MPPLVHAWVSKSFGAPFWFARYDCQNVHTMLQLKLFFCLCTFMKRFSAAISKPHHTPPTTKVNTSTYFTKLIRSLLRQRLVTRPFPDPFVKRKTLVWKYRDIMLRNRHKEFCMSDYWCRLPTSQANQNSLIYLLFQTNFPEKKDIADRPIFVLLQMQWKKRFQGCSF